MEIRLMCENDWTEVLRIYAEGLQTGHASFETELPTWEAWRTSHILTCSFVALQPIDTMEVADQPRTLLGWASLSRVSQRKVYTGVAEVSIYIAAAARGQGLGAKLLGKLIEASEEQGYWTLQSSVFPENTPSIKLHESYGFRVVGFREKIAQHHGIWRDTVLLERRSKRIGNVE